MKELVTTKTVRMIAIAGSIVAAFFAYRVITDATAPKRPAPLTHAIVTLDEDGFRPEEVHIVVGGTVTFRSVSGKHFWPASDFHPAHANYPAFDPKEPVMPDRTWSFTFTEPGRWRYHDHLAPYLTGVVVVADPGGTAGLRPECRDSDCWYGELIEILEERGIRAAFERVVALYEREPQFTHHCHNIVHELGHLAFGVMRKDEVALTRETAFCSYGFWHGFMESFVRDRGPENARDFCLALDADLVANAPDSTLQCFHGIGHGAVYLELPAWGDDRKAAGEALEVCDAFSRTSLQRSRCASGVFNTIATLYNLNEYGLALPADDPLALCRVQPETHQESCYISMNVALMAATNGDFPAAAVHIATIPDDRHAVQAMLNLAAVEGAERMNEHRFEDQVLACRNLQERLRLSCIQGFAYGFLEHGPPEREYVKPLAFCASSLLAEAERDACFDYIFGYLSFWYSSAKSHAVCDEMAAPYRERCHERVRETRAWREAGNQ